MDGIAQSPEVAARIAEIDLRERVIWFPVRHHSPACAWHVARLIREIRPDSVLIEGPQDATPLIPFLTYQETRMPVALYATFVQRRRDDLPARHAAYYPFCDYSPELAAIRAGYETGAAVRFIDLTFPEMVLARKEPLEGPARSFLDESYYKHSQFLLAACRRTGARDPDDLWDHLFEDGFADIDTPDFMRNVLAYCTLARLDYASQALATEGTLAREQAMAAAVAEETGRVIVVTGGFHTAQLPHTKPKRPPAVPHAHEDARITLIRYSFEQLDRLNGYASGMPSPEYYQRSWEGRDLAETVVELGRLLREKGGDVSADDEINALSHAHGLARMRGHMKPSREDLLDGIRAGFVKGSVDVEGVLVQAMARKLLAGDRVGDVPREAGLPPIVDDFRLTANRLRMRLDLAEYQEVSLDLYRSSPHREASRFFHRLRFLGIPFAEWLRGPDFVTGERLDRVQELWRYRWSPMVESTLVERSLCGSTLEEATLSLLLERFAEEEKQGQGRRSDVAASLLLDACRMGLHRHAQDLFGRVVALVAEDASFVSLVRTIGQVLLLHASREPLEAHDLMGLTEIAERAFQRACYLLPELVSVSEEEEEMALDAINALSQVPSQLDRPDYRDLLQAQLLFLADSTGGSAAMRGAACGLLFVDGCLESEELIRRLQGHLHGSSGDGCEGAGFLRGLLRTAKSILWQVPEIIRSVTEVLAGWDEESFVAKLPLLRLAFADLTPRETSKTGRMVAVQLGIRGTEMVTERGFSSADMMRGVEVNRRVTNILMRDGLEDFIA